MPSERVPETDHIKSSASALKAQLNFSRNSFLGNLERSVLLFHQRGMKLLTKLFHLVRKHLVLKIFLRLRGTVLRTSKSILKKIIIRTRRIPNFDHRASHKMKILGHRLFLQRSMVYVKFLVVDVNVALYPRILKTCNGRLKVGNLCIHDAALNT